MKHFLFAAWLVLLCAESSIGQTIAGGGNHSLVVCEDGSVQGWGWDNWNQATGTNPEGPEYVPGVEDAIAVAGGNIHSIALKQNGRVMVWGANSKGQRGMGHTWSVSGANEVEGVDDVVQIASGAYSNYVLTNDGNVLGWGAYNQNSSGLSSGPTSPTVLNFWDNIVQLAAGNYFLLALADDGTVYSRGQNTMGQLGRGTISNSGAIEAIPGLTDVVEICAGADHALARKSDGSIWAWGANSFGQLGIGNTAMSSVPIQVNTLTGVLELEAADNTSAARLDDGTVWTWGGGGNGTLGNGTLFQNISSPEGLTTLSGIIDIAAGGSHFLALDSDGQLWVWGRNFEGQCAVGSTSVSTPLELNSACVIGEYADLIGGDHLVSGTVYGDLNENCELDIDEGLLNIPIMVSLQPAGVYSFTNSDGVFAFGVDNDEMYSLTAHIPQIFEAYTGEACPPEYEINPTAADDMLMTGYDFGLSVMECPILRAEITSSRRRLCSRSTTTITVSNYGMAQAENVDVKLKMPEYVEFVSSDEWYELQEDSTYLFTVYGLNPGSSYQFEITDSVACLPNTTFLMQCTEVSISPLNYVCPDNVDPEWDGSSVEVAGTCTGDSIVRFWISNTGAPGDSDMGSMSEFRIFMDNQLGYTGVFQLAYGDSLEVNVSANGHTYRLEADQSAHHPGSSLPRSTIEACGNPIVTGMYAGPYDGLDWEKSIECMPITGSYDPNDKQVSPAGFTEEKYVHPESTLDYTIRFQNTGNDYAEIVILRDTITELLDLGTLEVLAASHAYEVELSGEGSRVLSFIFDDIFLPDSTTSPLESQGFVKFSIRPLENLPNGTIINNFADIYFDYNDPIRTNNPWIQLHDTVFTTTEEIAVCFTNSDTIAVVACDSYTSPSGNHIWDTSGWYTDQLVNGLGCDSVLVVNLQINDSSIGTEMEASACETYLSPSGLYTWTESGIYTDTLLNASGCDSLITVDLIINQNTAYSESISACDNYYWDITGVNYYFSGVYSETFTSSSGCDSLRTLELEITQSSASEMDISACNIYTSPSGIYTWNESGIYSDTIPNAAGCDSVITVNLNLDFLDVDINASANVLSANVENAAYQWLDCDDNFSPIEGETGVSFEAPNGNFAVQVSQNLCTDTTACYNVMGVGLHDLNIDSEITVYPNPTTGQITVNLGGSYNEIRYLLTNLRGQIIKSEFIPSGENFDIHFSNPPGIYFLQITTDESVLAVKKIVKL